MEEQEKTLQDYLAILSRRKFPMLVIMMAVFLLGVVVALVWPPTYRSSATILIQEQEIPADLVRSTVTSYATQRIQTISQRVMTRGNLMQIIEKYGLYEKERKRKTTEEILETMRKDIGLNMIDADVMDPRSGRPMAATIAFTLSYEGQFPDATQRVAGDLTSLYLAENLKTRKEKASETVVFLTDEAQKISQTITDVETKLAECKEKNANNLPELAALNYATLDRTERELEQLGAEERALDERRFMLEGQLAQINPLTMMQSSTGERILDPESRLKALTAEYASLTAKYSDQHPDVVKVKREMEGLKEQTGNATSTNETAQKLSTARTELAMVQQKYSPDHPDVLRLRKVVTELEKTLSGAERLPEQKAVINKPDNPAYIQVQSQLDSVRAEIKSARERKQKLKEKLADYEARVAQAPQIERDYLALTREHESTLRRYQDLTARQMEAQIGQELENESKGESFVLIDPAQFPEQPVKPNRIAITFLSLVFAVVCGLGYALLAEALDGTIRGVKSISTLLTAAPLAVIPEIFVPSDFYRRKRFNKIAVVTMLSSFVVVVLAIHFFWSPLDVLWFRSMRKAGNIMGV
ncbi:MAG: lipopolysaccharide biosynthesis protein [Gammaproteobacteria bacterium]|nr:lipopolysaccharide biosynthesis protein [Gammaproteobacteria bacterium]